MNTHTHTHTHMQKIVEIDPTSESTLPGITEMQRELQVHQPTLGTRGESGDEGRVWGRGESLGTRGESGDEGRAWARGESLGAYNCEGLTLHCICGVYDIMILLHML